MANISDLWVVSVKVGFWQRGGSSGAMDVDVRAYGFLGGFWQ